MLYGQVHRPAVAAAVEAGVQTRICDHCGSQDVDAWNIEAGIDTCTECARPLTGGSRPCSDCGCVMRVVHIGGCFACTGSATETSQGGEFGEPLAHPNYHILETPGGIDRMHEVEIPTEEYYSALRKYMGKNIQRHALISLTIFWS